MTQKGLKQRHYIFHYRINTHRPITLKTERHADRQERITTKNIQLQLFKY